MDTYDSHQRTRALLPAAKPHSGRSLQPKSATERLTPATKREIAVELEKLRSVFGYESGAWETAVPLYLDALADLPYDMLADAVSASIRLASTGDFFPRPGQLRALVSDRLELRRSQARSESKQGRDEEEWPDWLRDIWGPLPEGRRARNESLAYETQKRIESTRRLAKVCRLMREHGYNADQAWRVFAGGMAQPSEPVSSESFEGPLQRVRDAFGVTATESKTPKHEDDEEVRKAARELAIIEAERSNP